MSVAGINLTMARRSLIDISRLALIYALGLALAGIGMVALYPSIRDSSQDITDIYANLPDAFRSAVGLGGGASIGDYVVFINVEYLSLIWPIAMVVFVAMEGGALVAREIDQGTLPLWLSVPENRWSLLLSKLIGLTTGALLISIASATPIGFGGMIVKDGGTTFPGTVALAVTMWGFAIAIIGVASLFSSMATSRGFAAGMTGAVVASEYVVQIMSSLTSSLDWLRYFSFFTAFTPQDALVDDMVQPETLILFAIGIVAAAASLVTFQRRDIVM